MRLKNFICLLIIGMIVLFSNSLVFAKDVSPTFKLSNCDYDKDKLVIIDLSIDNIPSDGIHSFVLNILYDTTKLEYTGLGVSDAIYDKTEDLVVKTTTQGLKLVYCDCYDTGDSHIKSNGLICSLKFKVLNDSETIPLSFSKEWKYESLNPLKYAVFVDGSVIISKTIELYGDVDNDKVVDSRDLSLVQKYLLGKYILDEKYATFLKRMDVSGDGEIDISDMVLVRRYVMGMIKSLPVGTSF